MRLSDTIESFIKAMMQDDQREIELKRNELAEYFNCAPSQINYVLATRFTPDHGYVITSQRGGGGYIRIVRMHHQTGDHVAYILRERIGDSLDEQSARCLLKQLAESRIISVEDARLMMSALNAQALSAPMPEALKDALRAKIMRSMLLTIAKRQPGADGGNYAL